MSQAPIVSRPRNDSRPASYTGRVESATQVGPRRTLKEAAVALDRARRRAGLDPEDPGGLWRGLVTGEWSIVDEFDADGRRYVVVRRTEPRGRAADRALTFRERQAARLAGSGHANKLIAYEMGLAESTVAEHLKRAARKLGCRSRVDLVRVVAAVAPSAH